MDIANLIIECENEHIQQFKDIEEISLFNQEKVLNAFIKNKIALRHFSPSTGYGYDDTGRDTLNKLFADVFKADKAIVSPLIASGTHAIALVLFGLLRPNDEMLSISGMPYDTLQEVILGEGNGSLKDFNVKFKSIDLIDNNFDKDRIEQSIKNNNPKIIFIQRSRGYSWRNAFSIAELKEIICFVKNITDTQIIIDNCYGEFVENSEPLQVGADIIVGSLIKNPGGGIAPTGGYIAGKEKLINLIENRLTAPGVGGEVGSYNSSYQNFYQGFFMAPHVTAQALKCSILFGAVFDKLGYETLPSSFSKCNDIIRSIKFNTKDELVTFCQTIQKCSPIDSHVIPYPWAMPGYADEVIMAAGTFVQGASIELSADSPIKEPFIAYLQGALTYEHAKIAVRMCLESLLNI